MTLTTNPRNVKYIKRPPPEAHLYACEHCDAHVTLYVHPIEVTHRCRRTQKQAKLVERPLGWKRPR